jgi:short-subunit dehydrogenase
VNDDRGVIWITGASSGIGWASSLVLAREGWTVAASARDEGKLNNLASRHENIHSYPLDVADSAQRRAVHERVTRDLGWIEVLVNNAGYGMRGAVEEVRLHELRDLYDVNVFAPLATAQLVLPEMRARRQGRIINISSVVGRVAFPLSGLYASSKFALEGWSDAMRIELQPWDIQVVLIEPGPIRTKFARVAKDNSMQRLVDQGSPYSDHYRTFLEGGGVRGGTPWSASTVAWAVKRAVQDRRPYARYPVHYLAWIAPFLRAILPTSVFDRLLGSMFGFSPCCAQRDDTLSDDDATEAEVD